MAQEKEFNKELALAEIAKLEKRLEIIIGDIGFLKTKVNNGGKLSAKELDITIKDLDQIVSVMGERRDVGH
tara:strand:+ start:110 stop:322 length:213 start_codon:yes stop_codon:yes gene_type:complete